MPPRGNLPVGYAGSGLAGEGGGGHEPPLRPRVCAAHCSQSTLRASPPAGEHLECSFLLTPLLLSLWLHKSKDAVPRVLMLLFFGGGGAALEAYGSFQARGPIRAAAAGHSHARSKTHLQPTPLLAAMPGP